MYEPVGNAYYLTVFEISEEEQLTVLYILPILVACTQYGCINPCAAMMYEQGEAQDIAEQRMGYDSVMVFALDIAWQRDVVMIVVGGNNHHAVSWQVRGY